MSNILNIYLSGGVTNLPVDEKTKWRWNFQNKLNKAAGIYRNVIYPTPKYFDPCDYYDIEDKNYDSEYEVFEFYLSRLRDSNLVVVNFNDPKSIGTAMELILAKEFHIPVIGINEKHTELHPWLAKCCIKICSSIDEAVKYIRDFFIL